MTEGVHVDITERVQSNFLPSDPTTEEFSQRVDGMVCMQRGSEMIWPILGEVYEVCCDCALVHHLVIRPAVDQNGHAVLVVKVTIDDAKTREIRENFEPRPVPQKVHGGK